MHLCGRIPLLGALGTLLLGGHGVNALTLDIANTDSIKAAARNAAHGMVSFYNGNETGQIPGLLPGPYYWWEAGAMFGILIEYWYLTGDDTYNDLITQAMLFQVGPYNDYMPPNQTNALGNDDQTFWAFSAMTAAELKFPDPPPDQPSWLALAQAVFNLQTTRWDHEFCGGGLRWQIFPFNPGFDYKNMISSGGFFQLAARLARYTGNTTYAEWAEKSWDWMYDSPLITKEWKIWDGLTVKNNCTDADQIYWTYNVGTLLAGATYMYNYTNGNATWGQRVSGLMNGTNVFFVQSAGLNNPPKPGPPGGQIMAEVACEFPAAQTCNNDQPSFKAYLSRWMAMASIMAPFTSEVIMPRLQASALAAAAQCTGQPGGSACGRRWYQTVWDGFTGVGEQMSALSVIQSNLISKVEPPVTATKGGTSIGDPSAGGAGDDDHVNVNPVLTKTISTGDKAGAGVLTALTLLLVLATTWWIIS